MTKRPKVSTPSASGLLIPARATREKVDEFAPMVLYSPRRGIGYTAVLTGDEVLEDLLADCLAQMRAQLGPADWIAVTTDAFVLHTPEPLNLERGDLRKAFEAGDPNIVEQIIVVLKRRNLPAEMASQTYRYSVVDKWEWDEPETYNDYQGAVIDVLSHYL